MFEHLADVANATHFIDAKLKPVDRTQVKKMVKDATDALERTADGRDKNARQQTLEESLQAMRLQEDAHAMELACSEEEREECNEEEYLESEYLESETSGSSGKRPRGSEETDDPGPGQRPRLE